MDPKDVAAQQAKLAQHRAQQNRTKSDHQPTSAAKIIDPEGQIKAPRAVKRDFERAHDHAPPEMKPKPYGSPELDAGGPAPRPKPPGAGQNRDFDRLRQANEAHKAGQEGKENGNMKDGKDHD